MTSIINTRKTIITATTLLFLYNSNSVIASDIFDGINKPTNKPAAQTSSPTSTTSLAGSGTKCSNTGPTGRVLRCTGSGTGTITRDNSGGNLGDISITPLVISASGPPVVGTPTNPPAGGSPPAYSPPVNNPEGYVPSVEFVSGVVFNGPANYVPGTPGCTNTSDVSEDGIRLACVTKRPTSSPFRAPTNNGLKGAGSAINAYSMGAGRCNTNPPLTKSWQHNLDIREYKRNAIDHFALNRGESLSYKFTVPNVDAVGGFSYGESAQSGGSYAPVFMTITEAPCDFNTSKVASGPAQDFCYQSGVAGLAMGWTTILGASNIPLSYCRLKKGVTYYMNLRFQDARPVSEGGSPNEDSCTAPPCGGVLQTG